MRALQTPDTERPQTCEGRNKLKTSAAPPPAGGMQWGLHERTKRTQHHTGLVPAVNFQHAGTLTSAEIQGSVFGRWSGPNVFNFNFATTSPRGWTRGVRNSSIRYRGRFSSRGRHAIPPARSRLASRVAVSRQCHFPCIRAPGILITSSGRLSAIHISRLRDEHRHIAWMLRSVRMTS